MELLKDFQKTEIKVSVICLVYNHEKFLDKCLEGFVKQKTNFKYEVFVHDDKSTDCSKEIIMRYHEKYPDVIVPIYQEVNQYSLGIPIISDIILPRVNGKYIAICEGDDYWCNYDKLQIQFDYMESHNECSICLHNTIKHDLSGKNKDIKFNNWKVIHRMTDEEVFCCWKVHTSSYFYRKQSFEIPNWRRKYWFGDFVRLTWMFDQGEVVVIPQIMSVYNYRNSNSLLTSIDCLETKNRIEKYMQRVEYLKEYNEITNYRHNSVVLKRINDLNFTCYVLEKTNNILSLDDKKSIIEEVKSITAHEGYYEYIKSRKGIKRIKSIFKYKGYVLYPIWIRFFRYVAKVT